MTDARRLYPDFDITRSWALPKVPVQPGDESLLAYLTRLGFSAEQLEYTRRSYANATGDSVQYISVTQALADMTETAFGDGDFRILDGYDSVYGHWANGLDIRLNAPVRRITWSAEGVQVETAVGVFEGAAVVITLPLGVLQSGAVQFAPALPEAKQSAIRRLRMGPAIKLIYRLNDNPAPPGIIALYSAGTPPMWWSSSAGHDTSEAVWTALATGDYARSLLARGEAGALEAALATLREEFSRPDLRALDQTVVNWPAEPYTLGGYSVAAPGHADAREALAQPTGRLFWAGEATAPHSSAATVHGALLSGQRAAAEVLAALAH